MSCFSHAHRLAWIVIGLIDYSCMAAPQWPLNLPLTPKASGMEGLPSVYSVDITVGRDGPLALLVDTGSPAIVVQGEGGDTMSLLQGRASSRFLGADSGGSATIRYGGSTVGGDIIRNRVCFKDKAAANQDDAQSSHVCAKSFPVFEVQQKDPGFSQLGLDGILGLGPASGEANLGLTGMDETLLDGLAKDASAPRIFGLFISPGPVYGASVLSLGGYDSSKILSGAELQYVPLAQPSTGRWQISLKSLKLVNAGSDGAEVTVDVCQGRGDCRVLLDTGTAQIASVPEFADVLRSNVRNADTGDCAEVRSMPDIHIELGAGVVFKLGPEDYVLDRAACSLAVDEMSSEEMSRQKSVALILGQPFFRKVYAVFDQEQGRVGLAPSVASSGKTRNEVQKQEDNEQKMASISNYLKSA